MGKLSGAGFPPAREIIPGCEPTFNISLIALVPIRFVLSASKLSIIIGWSFLFFRNTRDLSFRASMFSRPQNKKPPPALRRRGFLLTVYVRLSHSTRRQAMKRGRCRSRGSGDNGNPYDSFSARVEWIHKNIPFADCVNNYFF
ncbi:MAG: hypothetical protein AB1724_08500 [Thermodesulfobacteriota bacterium]